MNILKCISAKSWEVVGVGMGAICYTNIINLEKKNAFQKASLKK